MSDSNDPLELGISSVPKFIPSMISKDHMGKIFQDVPEEVKKWARDLRDHQGWRIYSVKQTRGRCYPREKVITIPVWAIERKDITFKIWYISHELAHAYEGCLDSHGPRFMEWLKRICPANCIEHELGYKPRNAAAAGIGEKKKNKWDDLLEL